MAGKPTGLVTYFPATVAQFYLSVWSSFRMEDSLRRTWWVCRPRGLCSQHTSLSSRLCHSAQLLFLCMTFFSVGKCWGSRGYHCEASFSTGVVGVSCLLLRSLQSKQSAFSFSTKCYSPVGFRERRHRATGLSHGILSIFITSDTVEVVSDNPVIILPIRSF